MRRRIIDLFLVGLGLGLILADATSGLWTLPFERYRGVPRSKIRRHAWFN